MSQDEETWTEIHSLAACCCPDFDVPPGGTHAVTFHTASAKSNGMDVRRNKKPRTRQGLMLHIDSCLDSALAPRQSYSN